MKFWTTGIVFAWGVFLPALGFAQEPWIAPGPGYGPPGAAPSSYGYDSPAGDLYQELVPQSQFRFDNDSRRDLNFGEAFSQSYVRLDYLFWQISGGHRRLLGAPNSSGADLSGNDPDNMLLASDNNGARAPVPTQAVVPNLHGDRDVVNGLRGVFGIPTRVGTLESEVFYFENVNNQVNVSPYNSATTTGFTRPVIGATTLLQNGQVSSDTMILYSENYQAVQKSAFFGAESNWIFPALTPNVRTTVSPLLGFRYISFMDRLSISGTDLPDPGDPTTEMDHFIGSIARNNIFGPQIGLRFTTQVGRLDLGVEPKFVAGINRLSEGVNTQQIFSPNEADRNDSRTRTIFAPVFDLSVSAKLHVSDRFAFYVAYDLIVAGGFSRAYDNIYYNSTTSATTPNQISLRPQSTSFLAQGIAIGGELTFR